MWNKYITKREKGLIKGALRRVFSRSELRLGAMNAAKVIGHSNPDRPKVKTWYKCGTCGIIEAGYKMEVDHIEPVVPVNKTFDDMSLIELVDRLWCDPKNLLLICEQCHNIKTAHERKLSREFKKERKKNESSSNSNPTSKRVRSRSKKAKKVKRRKTSRRHVC